MYRFAFVRWYVDEEFYLYSTEDAEHFVGWGMEGYPGGSSLINFKC